jgi:hypothetical protein
MAEEKQMQKPTCEENADGTKEWFLNDKLHREDGPAIERANGTKSWWLNGELHREDGPAIERANGDKSWWLNGKLHREDGPAIEDANGPKEWYLNNKYQSPINVFKVATHEQQIHMLCFHAIEFMP